MNFIEAQLSNKDKEISRYPGLERHVQVDGGGEGNGFGMD